MTKTHTLVERLRARLVTVPKPGAEPFDPPAGFFYTATVGGEHKPGDDAGFGSFSTIGFFSTNPSKVQAMIYAIDPLCAEAADEIERLQHYANT